MSIESAKAYLERLENDEEFRDRVMDCRSSDERMEYAQSEGFSFTAKDICSIKDDLSEEELDRVAGGFFTSCKTGGVDIVPFLACV